MKANSIKITAQQNAGRAIIKILSSISEYEEGSNSSDVRKFVDEFISQGVREADVYVNSKGGDVFEATEIDNQFERFTSVTFYIGSVAASAATYISSNPKFKVVAKHNSQVMIHRPSAYLSGDLEKIKSGIKLLENITASYKERYAAKTGLSVQAIENMWAKGDCWMTAKEAKEKGFVDDIISADATEQSIQLAAFYDMPIEVPATRANWTIEDYLNNDPAALEVISRTNPALFDRLNEEHYGSLIEQGNKPKQPVQQQITVVPATRANWTIEDYLNNDPAALEVISRTNPALFDRMNNEYFGG